MVAVGILVSVLRQYICELLSIRDIGAWLVLLDTEDKNVRFAGQLVWSFFVRGT